MVKTFRGGFHIPEHKAAAQREIEEIVPPAFVYIPLSQHIGKAAEPVVSVGDHVDRGQLIADVTEGLGVPVHASVSGKVVSVDVVKVATGNSVGRITIENDYKNTLSPEIKDCEVRFRDLTPEYVIEKVRRAGISGMGGAGFPTYAKMKSALGRIDTMIINAVECEPYITADHRLLLEKTEEWFDGVKILLKVFDLPGAVVAIEDNKPDAIDCLERLAEETGLLDIHVLKTKYPQGDERQIIRVITGREIPAGKLPADVKCVVFNAETVHAIGNAVVHNLPLFERVVTVSGDCVSPSHNFLVPIGTSYRDLLNACGELIREPEKIICGGPMMGIAQWDLSLSVTKTTNALLFFSHKKMPILVERPSCIRCGRCADACPIHLLPNYLMQFSRAEDLDRCEQFGVRSCIECGTCAFLCPARIPLVQYMRMAKAKLRERDQKNGH